ncbi:MAG: hypothetical protein LUQ26_04040 [Methylococcaceae bacterium]|nr:hypothetical protein [Methylococcaceae bacterium]
MDIRNMLLCCRKSACSIFIAVSLGFSEYASALDLGFEDWQLHGFVSQGYILSSNYNFFGHSQSGGSFDFTEIGTNIRGHITPELLVAAQGLYRSTGGSDQENFRLDFANLDYHSDIDKQTTIGVRLGRVKNPFGLYNETRDVVWTRPGVFVPQSVYFDALALRQPMISSDGGLFYGRYSVGDHALTAEMVISEPLDSAGGATEFLTGIPKVKGTMGGRPMFLGRAGYEWQEGRFKVLFSVVDLDRDFKSATPNVKSGNVKAFYPLASVQLNLEKWSFTSEYGRVTTKRSGFTPDGQVFENTSESFYVQAQYRFMSDLSGLLRYDNFVANVNDRDGKNLAALTGLPKHSFYTRDLAVGVRWEFAQDWLLTSEYHSIWGTALLSGIDNPNLSQKTEPEHWDMFGVMMSFRF